MEHFVGIDVAKDRLDVHLRPSGETFASRATAKVWRSSWTGCRHWLRSWS